MKNYEQWNDNKIESPRANPDVLPELSILWPPRTERERLIKLKEFNFNKVCKDELDRRIVEHYLFDRKSLYYIYIHYGYNMVTLMSRKDRLIKKLRRRLK